MPNLKSRYRRLSSAIVATARVLRDRVWPERIDSIADFVEMLPISKPKSGIAAFSTDGCSGGMSRMWKRIFKRLPPWEGCCRKHDLAYWRGGFWHDRRQADIDLYYCVKEGGHPIWAALMYVAVRVGGSPVWPFNWRWGYGWSWTGRYERREDADRYRG